MNILFINLPYYGHFVPTVGLVQELVKQNHQVTYLMPYDWKYRVLESGAEFLGYENHKKLDRQIKNAFYTAEKVIEDYDLVIYEQFFFVGKHLAEKFRKPAVRIFTAPATNDALMRKYISSGGVMSIFQNKWIGKLWTKDVVKNMNIKMKTDSWLDEIVQNAPAMNLVYTMKEFQPYADAFPIEHYFFLGPSIYDRKETDFSLIKSNTPIIYISLGTIVKGTTSFFKLCIEAFKNEEVTIVMSVGKNYNINKLGVLPQNFIVKNFIPQISMLKQADVFVTHGGMNSVSEAMTFGVPMVVIPFVTDQPANAEQIEKLGLGKCLNYKKLDKQIIKETVYSILNDKQIQENTATIKDKVKSCLGNSGAVKLIENYYYDFSAGND